MRLRYAVLAGASLLAGAAYTIYWLILAGEIAQGIANWAEQRRAEGYVVEYSGLQTSGYPLRIQLQAAEVRLSMRQGDALWEWRAPVLAGHVLPYMPNQFVLSALEPQEIAHSNTVTGAVKKYWLAPDMATAKLGLEGGKLMQLALDLTGGEIHGDGFKGAVSLGRAQLNARQGNQRIEKPPLLEIAIEIENSTYPGFSGSALGEKLTRLSLNAGVEGVPPAQTGTAGIREWRDAGGIVQILEFRLDWGPLQLSAAGTTALDARNRLMGSLTARLLKYDGVISALHAAGQLSEDEKNAASLALEIIANAAGGAKGDLALPLVLQDGEVYLGPVRIARLQPLF